MREREQNQVRAILVGYGRWAETSGWSGEEVENSPVRLSDYSIEKGAVDVRSNLPIPTRRATSRRCFDRSSVVGTTAGLGELDAVTARVEATGAVGVCEQFFHRRQLFFRRSPRRPADRGPTMYDAALHEIHIPAGGSTERHCLTAAR